MYMGGEEEERDRPIRSDAWYASAVERSLQLLLAVVASSSGWAGATLLAPRRARMKPIIIIARYPKCCARGGCKVDSYEKYLKVPVVVLW